MEAMSTKHGGAVLPVRRVRFDWDGVETDQWHPASPEFAAGANAISLLMPHAEPFVIAAVRRSTENLDDAVLSARVRAWEQQEAAHFRAHRNFNRSLTANSVTARLLDSLGRRVFAWLGRRSDAFALSFAAAFELVAFASARWAEAHLHRLFRGADEDAATLYLWHLAEEVEHKGIVHDVKRSAGVGSLLYRLSLVVAFVVLIGFTIVGGLSLFCRTRSALNPLRWIRLVSWGFSLAFVLLPVLAMSTSDSFEPDTLVDPPWMHRWLSEYDPHTQTMPVWTRAGEGALHSAKADAA